MLSQLLRAQSHAFTMRICPIKSPKLKISENTLKLLKNGKTADNEKG